MKILGHYHHNAIQVRGRKRRKRYLDHICEAPSVPSTDAEIETNGPLQEDVFLPLPSSRPETVSQVTANQPTAGTSQSQSGNDSSGASPPGDQV